MNGEGHWRILARVHGVPAIYGTYLRPDKVHTSYVAGIASMNPHLLKFELHPGSEDPGAGNWGKAQPDIPPGQRRGLLATFNGGFKVASSQGGFFLNGTTRGVLQRGIASMVYYKNGDLTIGVWGQQGLRMTGQVAGVRQNLRPVVVNGRVPASVDQNVQTNWGATLGGGYFVWRSGVGVTADGRIIYVYGPALDVPDSGQPAAAGRLCHGDGTRHQPRLDVLHDLPAPAPPGEPGAGQPAADPGPARHPLLRRG